MIRMVSILLTALTAAGCGGGLQLTLVDAAHRRPSNVAVYFTVDDGAGEPVGGLVATDFRIYEDGSLVSVHESQQTIINPEVAAEHYTLLLVDMSGSVTESDQVPLLVTAAQTFTATVQSHQKVAVYAFDGAEDIHAITPFTESAGASSAGVERLASFRSQDPSTNLYGAIVKAHEVLGQALERGRAAIRFGTIVVFTDGTDRAARVTVDELDQTLDESPYDVFAIGVGAELDEGMLSHIGPSGYVLVSNTDAINAAFETVSQRIVGYTRRFYLLSYCSPARAGAHEVTVEAVRGEDSGSLTYQFDAAGFGPRCDPNTPPPFRMEGATAGRRARRRPAGGGVRIEVRAEASAGADPEGGDY